MHQTTNRLNIDAGYWTVCRDCCEWTDDAVEDCWNPQPGVGWVCPKCAARPAAVYGGFPLLEVPKPKPPEQRATLWTKILCWMRCA